MIHEQLIRHVCRHLNILESPVLARLLPSRKMCHGWYCWELQVLLDDFKVHAQLGCDLLQGDLKVFVYIAMGHGRKVGHLGQNAL